MTLAEIVLLDKIERNPKVIKEYGHVWQFDKEVWVHESDPFWLKNHLFYQLPFGWAIISLPEYWKNMAPGSLMK